MAEFRSSRPESAHLAPLQVFIVKEADPVAVGGNQSDGIEGAVQQLGGGSEPKSNQWVMEYIR